MNGQYRDCDDDEGDTEPDRRLDLAEPPCGPYEHGADEKADPDERKE